MVSKEDIKKSGAILFALKGYNLTSTADIADMVGLKKQSLYSHFKNKREIFMEIIEDQTKIINKMLNQTLNDQRGKPLGIILKELFECIVLIYISYKPLLFQSDLHFFDEVIINYEHFDWQKNLKSALIRILSEDKNGFDPIKYEALFTSFMILVRSCFLRIDLYGNELPMQSIWKYFWNGFGFVLKQTDNYKQSE